MRRHSRILGLLLLVVFVATAAGCAGGGTKKSTGEYVDDAAITAKVKTEIRKDSALSAAQINVDTYKGIVALGGFVDSEESKKKAGEAAARVAGVREVKNNLQVKK